MANATEIKFGDPATRIRKTATGLRPRRLSAAEAGPNRLRRPRRDSASPASRALLPVETQRVVTASGDKTARIWDAETGKEIALLKGHEGEVFSASFSPDGRRVVTAESWDKTARIRDAETGEERAVLRGHGDWVYSLAFSPDGQTLASCSKDGTIKLWSAHSLTEPPHRRPYLAVEVGVGDANRLHCQSDPRQLLGGHE